MKKILVMLTMVIGVAVSGGAGAGWGKDRVFAVGVSQPFDQAKMWGYQSQINTLTTRLLKLGTQQAELEAAGALIPVFQSYARSVSSGFKRIPYYHTPVFVPTALRGKIDPGDVIAIQTDEIGVGVVLGIIYKSGTSEANACHDHDEISECDDKIPTEWRKQ